MSKIGKFEILEEIYTSTRSWVVRARGDDYQNDIILKSSFNDHPEPAEIATLHREFEIYRKIDDPRIVKALDFVKIEHRSFIVQEIALGRSLDSMIKESHPFSLEQVLAIGIEIAEALQAIHGAGIIHKDINPRNIIYDIDSQKLTLIDFGIATMLNHESSEINVKGFLEGSLDYISPEQTGRLNRALDYRSDFYSLGATLFHLAAGETLFDADDPLGYVHCHIAQTPRRIDSIKPNIPETFANIIMKLLEKCADNRYASDAGIIYDFTQCLNELKADKPVKHFILGVNDFSHRFEIPQKLYGRTKECAAITDIFNESKKEQTHFLTVSGFSGIGKSSLVAELSTDIIKSSSFFIKGKFDQYARNVPYSALCQALEKLVDQVLRLDEYSLSEIRTNLKTTLGMNGKIITDLIPDFEKVIGHQEDLPPLNTAEAVVRNRQTLLDFIRVFSSAGHNLVLFLDDLQWSDGPTLTFLEDLATSQYKYNLMVILAYRHNEVNDGHPFSISLEEIEKSKPIKNIFLGPLELDTVKELISDTLKLNIDSVTEIANHLISKTDGNPFYLCEFLKKLYKDKLIYLDINTGEWNYDLDEVKKLQAPADVVQFMLTRLDDLPSHCIEVLKYAACIGCIFDLKNLATISQRPEKDIAKNLMEIVKIGIISPLEEKYNLITEDEVYQDQQLIFNVSFRFQHDRVQQAAYSLIPKESQVSIHYSIARLLLNSNNEVPKIEIARHFVESLGLIEENLRWSVFTLTCGVGNDALKANAYKPAVSFLETAEALVGEKDWADNFNDVFSMYRSLAESYFLSREFDKGEKITFILLNRAKNILQKAKILDMQAIHYENAGQLEKSIDISLKALRLFGYRLYKKTTMARIGLQLIICKLSLGFRQPMDLLDGPEITDELTKLKIKILMSVTQSAYLAGYVNLYPLCILKGTTLIHRKGICPEAAWMLAVYNVVLFNIIHDTRNGAKYARLTKELVERNKEPFLKGRGLFSYGTFISFWHSPQSVSREYFKRSIALNYQTGNQFDTAVSAINYAVYAPTIDAEMTSRLHKKHMALIKEMGVKNFEESSYLVDGLINSYLGKTTLGTTISTDTYNEYRSLERMRKNKYLNGIAGYHVVKMEILFLRGKIKAVLEHGKRAASLLDSVMGTYYELPYRIFRSVAMLRRFKKLNMWNKLLALAIIPTNYFIIRIWRHYNADTFSSYLLYFRAEIMQALGRPLEQVINSYEEAIKVSASHSPRVEAIVQIGAMEACLKRGMVDLASIYYYQALYACNIWGAHGITAHLEKKYSSNFINKTALAKPIENTNKMDTTMTRTMMGRTGSKSITSSPNNDLDYITVIKSSQSLSSEMNPESLIMKLLKAMIENAGAEKGVFVSQQNEDLIIKAIGCANSDQLNLIDQKLQESEDVPAELIQFV
ncbi:MAG: hypothetical protein CMP10_21740, partial [Zetaproteobacteria bacterium]|nr:hypothetical protein [Pseudobdellovibrionaceae bacterium]